jgi:hypothetical protein
VRQAGDTSKVWCGNAGGGIGNHLITETISSGGTKKFHVKAVRDMQAPPLIENRFIDNGDGTITDQLTQLMWQKNPPSTTQTWEQALSTAQALSLAGYDDWRLPNIKELYSIHDAGRTNPAINPIFGLQAVAKYWASTSIPGQQGVKAWYFDTRFGITTYELKTVSFPIISVRGPVSVITALRNETIEEPFLAWPNPSSDSWNFSGLKPGEEIRILDARGREVFSGEPDRECFRHLPPGLFSAKDSYGRSLKLVKF